MRIVLLTAAFLSMCIGAPRAELSGGDTNPYIKLSHVIKNGTLRISAKNISNKPVVAYVVAVEDGAQSTTHHDYYTGRDSFGPGKTIELVFAFPSTSSTPKVFVDYVRFSDGTISGALVTDDGKDVAASFQK
jgi:hypothetical protein